MMEVEESAITSVGENTVERETITHDWEMAVAINGLFSTGDERFAREATALVDRSVATQTSAGEFSYGPFDTVSSGVNREHRSNVGTPPIGYGVLEVYERTGEARYLDAARKQYEYLQSARRTADGAISTFEDDVELWVDTMYMVAPFLARFGAVADEPAAFDEAVTLLDAYSTHLRDPSTGLYRHSWIETPNSFRDSTLWARGNGWVAMSLLDTLEHLPETSEAHEHFVDQFRQVIGAVAPLQDDSGLWHDLLDDPESQLEVSGSAMLAYAIRRGMDRGLLDASAYESTADDAMEACLDAVDEAGNVRRVSGPPGGPGCPLGDHLFGQGAFLLAATQFERA